MQIALTQKLATGSGKTLSPAQENVHPLFDWTANWVKVWANSRTEDMLIVLNNSTRFVVAIYPIKKKELKQMDSIIKDAIANTLLRINVNPELVTAYMEQIDSFTYVKNSNRKISGYLTQAANEVVYEVYDVFDGIKAIDHVIDDTVGYRFNYLVVNGPGGSSNPVCPYETFLAALSSHYGIQAYNYQALELLVTLDLGIYQAVRRLIVPAQYTFAQLHDVLQSAFSWKNSHLHDFSFYSKKSAKNKYKRPDLSLVMPAIYEGYGEVIDKQQVSDYLSKYKQVYYTYDFGDNWQHEIKLVKTIENYHQESPYLLEAIGQTPPEDVGGVPGFIEFSQILADSNHPEYQSTEKWAGYWRPELNDWEKRPRMIRL